MSTSYFHLPSMVILIFKLPKIFSSEIKDKFLLFKLHTSFVYAQSE